MKPKEDSKHYILTITIGMDTCLVRHWSCSTQRARTGFAMPIAAKKKKEEGEFAFIKAKAVVPSFCFVQQLQTTSRILDPLTSI
jgi:hypothetical protein